MKGLALTAKGKKMSGLEHGKALTALGESLHDWTLKGGELSFIAFREYILSEHVTLPFSGGFLEQPQWVIDDFGILRTLYQFHYLNEDLRDAK